MAKYLLFRFEKYKLELKINYGPLGYRYKLGVRGRRLGTTAGCKIVFNIFWVRYECILVCLFVFLEVILPIKCHWEFWGIIFISCCDLAANNKVKILIYNGLYVLLNIKFSSHLNQKQLFVRSKRKYICILSLFLNYRNKRLERITSILCVLLTKFISKSFLSGILFIFYYWLTP